MQDIVEEGGLGRARAGVIDNDAYREFAQGNCSRGKETTDSEFGARWIYVRRALAYSRDSFQMFSAAKDLFAGKAARTYANNLISRYGKIDELSIDSGKRRAHVTCSLDGEVSPVTVDIDSYKLHREGSKSFIEIEACRCNRRWVQTLMLDHVKGKRFEVPSWAAAAL